MNEETRKKMLSMASATLRKANEEMLFQKFGKTEEEIKTAVFKEDCRNELSEQLEKMANDVRTEIELTGYTAELLRKCYDRYDNMKNAYDSNAFEVLKKMYNVVSSIQLIKEDNNDKAIIIISARLSIDEANFLRIAQDIAKEYNEEKKLHDMGAIMTPPCSKTTNGVLNTELIQKIFKAAIEKGWMRYLWGNRYEWLGINGNCHERGVKQQFAYFCGEVFRYREYLLPTKELEKAFEIKNLNQYIYKAYNSQSPQKWRKAIDELIKSASN